MSLMSKCLCSPLSSQHIGAKRPYGFPANAFSASTMAYLPINVQEGVRCWLPISSTAFAHTTRRTRMTEDT